MASTHLLLAAFTPFRGRERNESEEAVAALRLPRLLAARVRTLLLPVSWRRAAARLAVALDRPGLGAVVLVGEAGRRELPTPETWGRRRNAPLRDEDGALPGRGRGGAGQAVRRRATWDPADVVRVLARAGVPARVSRDAGGFLCNAVLYQALEHPRVRGARLPVTFLHLPVPGAGARADVGPRVSARAVDAVVRAGVRALRAEDAPS